MIKKIFTRNNRTTLVHRAQKAPLIVAILAVLVIAIAALSQIDRPGRSDAARDAEAFAQARLAGTSFFECKQTALAKSWREDEVYKYRHELIFEAKMDYGAMLVATAKNLEEIGLRSTEDMYASLKEEAEIVSEEKLDKARAWLSANPGAVAEYLAAPAKIANLSHGDLLMLAHIRLMGAEIPLGIKSGDKLPYWAEISYEKRDGEWKRVE